MKTTTPGGSSPIVWDCFLYQDCVCYSLHCLAVHLWASDLTSLSFSFLSNGASGSSFLVASQWAWGIDTHKEFRALPGTRHPWFIFRSPLWPRDPCPPIPGCPVPGPCVCLCWL